MSAFDIVRHIAEPRRFAVLDVEVFIRISRMGDTNHKFRFEISELIVILLVVVTGGIPPLVAAR